MGADRQRTLLVLAVLWRRVGADHGSGSRTQRGSQAELNYRVGEEAVTAQSDLVTGPLLRQEKAGINEFPTTFPGPFLDLIVNAPAKPDDGLPFHV